MKVRQQEGLVARNSVIYILTFPADPVTLEADAFTARIPPAVEPAGVSGRAEQGRAVAGILSGAGEGADPVEALAGGELGAAEGQC